MNKWHVSVAAEAFAAGMFARCEYDVSVQYGANQPEYDLIISKGEQILKISVKGSQEGQWGLTQSYVKDANYHKAADLWLEKHNPKTILCFVQFKNSSIDEMPRIYLATPQEVVAVLKNEVNKRGDSILREKHVWKKGAGVGTVDEIPQNWKFSIKRIEELLKIHNQ